MTLTDPNSYTLSDQGQGYSRTFNIFSIYHNTNTAKSYISSLDVVIKYICLSDTKYNIIL